MNRTVCKRCGTDILSIRCYDERDRDFHTVTSTNPDIGENQRWYVTRSPRRAINGGLRQAPPDEPFLTLHQCRPTRLGTGEVDGGEIGKVDARNAIALRADIPTVAQCPLTLPGRRWTYRWPSSWAHIVVSAHPVALCRAAVRLPEEMTARERERIATMRTCADCAAINARQEDRNR